jgi:hypothetical protein
MPAAPDHDRAAPYARHPDLDQALWVDDHGPAFASPWLDPTDHEDQLAAERGRRLASHVAQTQARGDTKGLIARIEAGETDPHDLAALRLRERPAGHRPPEGGQGDG